MKKHVKKGLAGLLCFLFIFSALAGGLSISEKSLGGGTAYATGNSVKQREKPKYEEGKINLVGGYTVGSDGKLTEELEWSFPYVNPLLPEEGRPDPARPYRYKLWQAKKSAGGTWSGWETRSPVDVDKKDGSVWVLNVAPNDASKAYLKSWMDKPVTDYDGSMTTVGRGIINVHAVTIDEYNANPEQILKTNPVTGTLEQEYQFSVIMFGTYDANASKDLTAVSRDATEAFSKAGGGLMFGHDTLTGWTGGVGVRTYFKRFAEPDFLNITLADEATTFLSTNVKVVDAGFLTSRPWDLEGKTLTIPQTHMLGQKAGGYNADGSSKNRVWMKFSDASGNPVGTVDENGVTNNYYLVTNGSNAMIQTGHTSGGATEDEAKVFANTLIYLAQSTTTTTAKDASFIDEAVPSSPQGRVSSIEPETDLTKYTATIELSGAVDYGTDYAYRIQAVPQTTLSDMTDYQEIWSSEATDPEDESILHQTALSGLRGYYIKGINNNGSQEAKPTSITSADLLLASDAGDKVTKDFENLVPGQKYYVHAYAVDWAGNVSEDIVLPIEVSGRSVTFHYNYGGDDEETSQTLLTFENKFSTMPESVSRTGYEFLGWYIDEEGTGEAFTADSVFDEETYGDDIHLYAKWQKVWNVTVGQRGSGRVTVSSGEQIGNPFFEGKDVTVTWEASPGYTVKGVWLDGVLQEASANGSLTIPAIERSHYVMVEFLRTDGVDNTGIYSVETQLSGGGADSKITPSVQIQSSDPKAKNYKVSWTVADGYRVQSVKVDGVNRTDLIDRGSITFSRITEDHKVEVVLVKADVAPETYRVTTVLTGGPGSATPSKDVTVGANYDLEASVSDTQNYTIKAITIYDASGAVVRSTSVGDVTGTERLENIQQNYRIVIEIEPKQQAGTVVIPNDELMRVETSVTGSGSISPSVIIRKGDDYAIDWQAEEGWRVQDVTIDGDKIYYTEKEMAKLLRNVAEGDSGDYAFEDVAENHTLHVTFVKEGGEEKAGFYKVVTGIRGQAEATITAGNSALEEGSSYTVEWTLGNDTKLVDVLVNGDSRKDLMRQNSFTIENLDQDYMIEIVVEKPYIYYPPVTPPKEDPDTNIDTNGDGKPDTNIDTDGDGKPDTNIDTNGDGKPDTNIDTDGDGKPDTNIDSDGDGKPDVNIDTNGDGKPDTNIDTDGDGKPDVNIDTNGNGKPDINIDTNKDGKPDLNIDTNGDGKPDLNIDTDGDGKPDLNIDTDGDGKPDTNLDTDKDGKPDINVKDKDEIGNINGEGEMPKTEDASQLSLWLTILGMTILMLALAARKLKQVK